MEKYLWKKQGDGLYGVTVSCYKNYNCISNGSDVFKRSILLLLLDLAFLNFTGIFNDSQISSICVMWYQ